MSDLQQERSKMLGTMPMNQLVPKVSLPIMISMLVQALYNIVDSIFVAMYSPDAFTAVNFAFPLQMLLIAVSTGMGAGINSLISRRLGEKRLDAAQDAAKHGLFVEGCGWLLFVLVGLFVAQPILRLFTSDEVVLDYGTTYLRIVTIASIGLFMSICFERMMQSTGNTTLSMATQLTGAVVNIILDPIMIFTCGMGIAGAAWATVIGQFSSMTLGFFLNQRFNQELRLRGGKFHLNGYVLRDILVVGLPSTVMQAISSLCNFCMNWILTPFGDTAVNVLGAYFKLQSFVFMPVFGLTNGMVPIVGYNFGARHRKRVYECVRVSLKIALCIMGVGMLVFLVAPQLLLALFDKTETHAITEAGSVALRIISSHFLLAAAGITLSTVFQAVGKGVYSLIMSLCRQLIVLVPAAFLLSKLGLNAIWWAFPIAEGVSLMVCLILYARCDRELLRPLDDPAKS